MTVGLVVPGVVVFVIVSVVVDPSSPTYWFVIVTEPSGFVTVSVFSVFVPNFDSS